MGCAASSNDNEKNSITKRPVTTEEENNNKENINRNSTQMDDNHVEEIKTTTEDVYSSCQCDRVQVGGGSDADRVEPLDAEQCTRISVEEHRYSCNEEIISENCLKLCEADEVGKIYGSALYDCTDETLPENALKRSKTYVPPIEKSMRESTRTPVNTRLQKSELACNSLERTVSAEIRFIYGALLEDRTDEDLPINKAKRLKEYIPEIERRRLEATKPPVNSQIRMSEMRDSNASSNDTNETSLVIGA